MATLSRGQSFGATETITNTKLHNLVDLGSVSGIVDADIAAGAAISFSKIAQGNVDGALLTGLGNITSGAGTIPQVNLPFSFPLNTSYLSLASIRNQDLQPLTLASWVDGASLRNLASIPSGAGQVYYKNIVSSLASGAVPQYNGVNSYVGYQVRSHFQLISATSFSTASGTGDITISTGKTYMVVVELSQASANGTLTLTFNNDTAGSNYSWYRKTATYTASPTTSTSGSSSDNSITIFSLGQNGAFLGKFTLHTFSSNTVSIVGDAYGNIATVGEGYTEYSGRYDGGAATSFEIDTSAGTITGVIYLYEIGHS